MSKAGIPEPTVIDIEAIPPTSAKRTGQSDYTKLIQSFLSGENEALQWEFPKGKSIAKKNRKGEVKKDEFIFVGQQERDKIASGLYSSRTKLGLDNKTLVIITRDRPHEKEVFGVYMKKPK